MTRRALRLLGVLIPLAAGCTTWRPVVAPVPDSAGLLGPQRLRVTDSAGHRLTGTGGQVRAGVVLLHLGNGAWDSMPVGQVARMERREVSTGRTVGLLVAIPAVALVVLIVGLAVHPIDTSVTGL